MQKISTNHAATIIAALAAIGTTEQLRAIGATNGRAASPRTASFDLPDGKYHLNGDAEANINRIKITDEGDNLVTVKLISVPTRLIPVEGECPQEYDTTTGLFTTSVGQHLAAKIGLTV